MRFTVLEILLSVCMLIFVIASLAAIGAIVVGAK